MTAAVAILTARTVAVAGPSTRTAVRPVGACPAAVPLAGFVVIDGQTFHLIADTDDALSTGPYRLVWT